MVFKQKRSLQFIFGANTILNVCIIVTGLYSNIEYLLELFFLHMTVFGLSAVRFSFNTELPR